IGAAGALSSYFLIKALFQLTEPHDAPIIESPLRTLIPKLSEEEIEQLPYPPNVLPGARDVETPYGTIRIYEWGPEDGRRVLLIHGISTPCVSMKSVADTLVEKAGCRVMLFDLFGRGYSDTPTQPLHNLQLYTSQILLALTSSPVSWTGRDNTFTIVGYSLGGGLASTFSSYFPSMVSHVILLASGGLVRQDRISWKSRILYGTEGWLPEGWIRWAVGRRLGKGQTIKERWRERDGMVESDGSDESEADGGQGGGSVFASNANPILGSKYPGSTEAGITNWQLDNCQGFIATFISCIRNAPIHGQHERFRILAKAFDEHNANSERKKKALLLLGSNDPIIMEKEIIPDMQECLGERNLEVLVVKAGHEVPISNGTDVANAI
ncbi:alpha/beta-hydrolase, partial [Rhizodiscina lignyota]